MAGDYPVFDGSQACAGEDPEAFFPPRADEAAASPARSVCRRCAFVRSCLAFALDYDVTGVWGGTTERQRDRLRDLHGIHPHPVYFGAGEDDLDHLDEVVDQLSSLSGGGLSADEIGHRLGVTSRTVQRARARVRSTA